MAVQDWSTTASSNNAAPPNGAPEGQTPGSLNNCIREVMASVAVESQINRVKVLGTVAGTNTITAAMTPALTAYSAGMTCVFTPANANTGAATLNVDSLSALDVFRYGGEALQAGDFVAGVPAYLILDAGADDFYLLNPQNVGFRNLPQNEQTTNYGCVLSDASRAVRMNGTSLTVTIPANASVAFPLGSVLTFLNINASALSIAITTDTLTLAGTTTTGTRTLAQNGIATAYKYTTLGWLISGTGLS